MVRTEDEIRSWLRDRVATATNVPSSRVRVDEPFAALGVTSSVALEISGDLEDWLERPIDPTLAWDHPTINRLAAWLATPAP
ncbi:MAG: acyl carrier protein [Polyangiaceae bacterium]|nr:acyl carrier protein [Polyangiaceae bacterium]